MKLSKLMMGALVTVAVPSAAGDVIPLPRQPVTIELLIDQHKMMREMNEWRLRSATANTVSSTTKKKAGNRLDEMAKQLHRRVDTVVDWIQFAGGINDMRETIHKIYQNERELIDLTYKMATKQPAVVLMSAVAQKNAKEQLDRLVELAAIQFGGNIINASTGEANSIFKTISLSMATDKQRMDFCHKANAILRGINAALSNCLRRMYFIYRGYHRLDNIGTILNALAKQKLCDEIIETYVDI